MPNSEIFSIKEINRQVDKLELKLQTKGIQAIPATIEEFGRVLGDPRTQQFADFQLEFLHWFQDINNMRGEIKSARGTGKSLIAGICSLWSALKFPDLYPDKFKMGYHITILGGSFDQAKNVYNFIENWCMTDLVKPYLAEEPRREYTLFNNRSWIRVLRASKTSVHGPHPEILWIDEAMDATDDIITEALPQVDSSSHGRWVMSSTPYVPFGVFIDFWNHADEYGIRTFGPWQATQAHWIKNVEVQQKSLSKSKFRISYLGIEDTGEGSVFDHEAIKACQEIYPIDDIKLIDSKNPSHGLIWDTEITSLMGLDWGQNHPTVLTVGQEDPNDIIRVTFLKEWKKFGYMRMGEEISRYYQRFYPAVVNADAEAKGENERLQKEHNVTLRPINFHLPHKHELVENTRWFLEHRKVYLHPVLCQTLIRQLITYMYEPKKTTLSYAKGNDDYVDSFMLFLWGYKHAFGRKIDFPVITTIQDRKIPNINQGAPELRSVIQDFLARRDHL